MGRSYNRRSELLDPYIGEKVVVTFYDDDVAEGYLEFDEPEGEGLPPSGMYSVKYEPEHPDYERIFFRKSHVISISVPDSLDGSDEPDCPGEQRAVDPATVEVRTLKDALAFVPDDVCFAVGCRTSFIFMGTKADFMQDISFVEGFYSERHNDAFTPFADREIVEAYKKDAPFDPAMLCFILEGDEDGKVWGLPEYRRMMKRIRRKAQATSGEMAAAE